MQVSAIGKITFTQQPEVGAEQQKVIDFQKDTLLKPRQPLKTGDLVQFQIRTVNHENIWQAVNVSFLQLEWLYASQMNAQHLFPCKPWLRSANAIPTYAILA